MAKPIFSDLLHYLRVVCRPPGASDLTDAQMLDRYLVHHEDAAFTLLVQRHGPMVLGVCRRVLGDAHGAEDVFQATFMVLLRRAASLRRAGSLGGWLYGVAQRIASRARLQAAARRNRERPLVDVAFGGPTNDCVWRDLRAVLDEEIVRLPKKLCAPIVLCYLQEKSYDQAARELGWSKSALARRLTRARELLRNQLVRRGVELTAATLATALCEKLAAAPVSALLTIKAVKAALASAGGKALASSGVSAGVIALAEEGMAAMPWVSGKVVGVLVAIGVMVGGVGWVGYRGIGEAQPILKVQALAPAPMSTMGEQKKDPRIAVDLHGDPLPEGAIARLGTLQQRAPAAKLAVTLDGKEVIAVSESLTVRRFDSLTGKLRALHQLPGRGAMSWISPHGTYALSLSFVGAPTVHQELDLWNLAQQKRTQVLILGQGLIRPVVFSDDERFAAFADIRANRDSQQVTVWDLVSSKSKVLWSEKSKIANGPYGLPELAISPNGQYVAAHFPGKTLRCWDNQSGQLLWEASTDGPSPLFFSPDGRTLVSIPEIETHTLTRWDARTGKLSEVKNRLPKEARHVIGFVPSRVYLALGTDLEEIIIWDSDAAKVVRRLPAPHTWTWGGPVAGYGYAFTPDGTGAIRLEGSLQRWDLITGKPVYADTERWGHTSGVLRIRFSPDGSRLASSSVDHTARVWSVATARPLHVFPKDHTHHLAFTPDGQFLFVRPPGNGEVGLRKWDLATGQAVKDYTFPDQPGQHPFFRSKEVEITADAKKVVMTNARWDNGYKTWLTAWDALSAKCLDHKKVTWSMDSVLTADGQSVVAFDPNTSLLSVLDTASGKPRLQFATDRHSVERLLGCDIAVSPSGRLVAARAWLIGRGVILDDEVRIGDMRTGRQITKLSIPRPVANQKNAGDCFAFTSDDRLFAAITADGVRLWETASWQEVGSIKDTSAAPAGQFFSLAFAPDGRTLATGHADSTILLWDATLGFLSNGPRFAPSEVDGLWADLADMDAPKAYRAIWRLVGNPEQAISLLRAHLQPVVAAFPNTTRPLIERVDSSRFQSREDARKELAALGEAAEPALHAALKANPSLEMRKRLEPLLDALNPSRPLRGTALRDVRAVQILERIGNAEARRMLQRLARGLASASLTRAAKEALARCDK